MGKKIAILRYLWVITVTELTDLDGTQQNGHMNK